jgi:hypothetical protein
VKPVFAKEIQRRTKHGTKVLLRACSVAARQEAVAVGRTRLDMLGVAPI